MQPSGDLALAVPLVKPGVRGIQPRCIQKFWDEIAAHPEGALPPEAYGVRPLRAPGLQHP